MTEDKNNQTQIAQKDADNKKRLDADCADFADKKNSAISVKKNQRNPRQKNKSVSSVKSVVKNSDATIDSDKICLTQKAAAKYACVNIRTIQRWLKDGMPTATVGDKKVYLKVLLDQYKQNSGHKQTDVRARKEEADAKYREKRVEELERRLADKEKEIEQRIQEALNKRIPVVKNVLLAAPRKISQQFPENMRTDIYEKVKREMMHAINIFAGTRRNPKF